MEEKISESVLCILALAGVSAMVVSVAALAVLCWRDWRDCRRLERRRREADREMERIREMLPRLQDAEIDRWWQEYGDIL